MVDAEPFRHVREELTEVALPAAARTIAAGGLEGVMVAEGVQQGRTRRGRREYGIKRLAVVCIGLLVVPVGKIAEMGHHVHAEFLEQFHRETGALDGGRITRDVGVAHQADRQHGTFVRAQGRQT